MGSEGALVAAGVLTEEQVALLEDVREAARSFIAERPALVGDASLLADHFLLRFLRARQWHRENVLKMLTSHLHWMQEKDVVGLMGRPFPELALVKRFYPTGFHGTDKLGRPIYVDRVGKLDMARLMQHVTHEQVVDNYIRESERQIRLRFPACSLARGEVVDRSLNIVDLAGLSFSLTTHAMAKRVVRQMMAVSQDHYPETCGSTLIVNCPQMFYMVWSNVKHWLDEVTVRRIRVVDRERTPQALLELVDADQLPAFLGGRCECHGEGGCLSSNLGPWQRPDICAHLAADPDNHWRALTPEGCRALVRERPVPVPAAVPEAVAEAPAAPPARAEAPAPEEPIQEELRTRKAEVDSLDRLSELRAKRELLEQKHLQMLVDWALVSRELVAELGRATIERAQSYYDAQAVVEKLQQELAAARASAAELEERLAAARARQERAEESFHVYLEDPTEAGISEEEWKGMLPDMPECPEDFRDDGKLLRAWRMAVLSDAAVALRRAHERALGELARTEEEAKAARERFEREAAGHGYCTWNCSVRRAQGFFERRRSHELAVDLKAHELQAVDDELDSARLTLEAAVRETPTREASFASTSPKRDLVTSDYEMAEFFDCYSSEEDGHVSDSSCTSPRGR